MEPRDISFPARFVRGPKGTTKNIHGLSCLFGRPKVCRDSILLYEFPKTMLILRRFMGLSQGRLFHVAPQSVGFLFQVPSHVLAAVFLKKGGKKRQLVYQR